MSQPLESLQLLPQPETELASLLRLVLRARGFALAFVKSNLLTEREHIVEVVSQSLKSRGRSGRCLHLRDPVIDLLEEISHLKPPLTPEDVLFVLGFEKSIPPEADFAPVLAKLNMTRERFRDLPCPIVIVLPDYALTRLARQAPDFWSWRSGVFEFEVSAEELASIMQRESPLSDRDLRSRSPDSIREHLEVLQEILSEYEARGGFHSEKLNLLNQIAADLVQLSDFEKARIYAEKSVEAARRAGDLAAEAEALNILAVALADLGHYEEALQLARQAVARFRSLAQKESASSQEALAASLSNLGTILGSLRQLDEALEALQEAVMIRRRWWRRPSSRIGTSRIGSCRIWRLV